VANLLPSTEELAIKSISYARSTIRYLTCVPTRTLSENSASFVAHRGVERPLSFQVCGQQSRLFVENASQIQVVESIEI
jgi:hypothetical protein